MSSASGRSLLATAQQFGTDTVIGGGAVTSGTSLPPQSFTYQTPAPYQWTIVEPSSANGQLSFGISPLIGDLDNDGRQEVIRPAWQTCVSDEGGRVCADGASRHFVIATDGTATFSSYDDELKSGRIFTATISEYISETIRLIPGTFDPDPTEMDVASVTYRKIYDEGLSGQNVVAEFRHFLTSGLTPYVPETSVPWTIDVASGNPIYHDYFGDFDGDGQTEALFATTAGSQVWEIDGSGTFAPIAWSNTPPLGLQDHRPDVPITDLNGDGKADLGHAVNTYYLCDLPTWFQRVRVRAVGQQSRGRMSSRAGS